eukprot:scaffold2154_cov283-Chaetoceros_neogracile.AAC.24
MNAVKRNKRIAKYCLYEEIPLKCCDSCRDSSSPPVSVSGNPSVEPVNSPTGNPTTSPEPSLSSSPPTKGKEVNRSFLHIESYETYEDLNYAQDTSCIIN